MSDLIAIVSIVSSAIVILMSIYFNWKKLKLEEKMLTTKIALTLYPKLEDKAIAMGIAYSKNIPSDRDLKSLKKLEEATIEFQNKWIKKYMKKTEET